MSDPPTPPDPGHDAGVPPKAPAWVKGLGVAIVVLVLLVLVAIVLLGGDHGPGRHGG